ncbi:sorting nexin-19 isoform X2 [Parasteatoda tepidariorum]|uniref:sorting nexin-19 isoform X2 n=1 Tax=Parasteatoda tepidariorum TaxID=114398 RepID=UPI00077F8E3E|nr:sorting nexin-19 isoform X2 [Parasteatoda tepidariorum]
MFRVWFLYPKMRKQNKIHMKAKKSSESFSWDNVQMRHWAMRDTATERCYLQSLISALLDKFGPFESENSLHSKSCSLLHAIVVEILTETLIQPLVRVFSDPSRINLLILWILANKEDSTETLTVAKLPSNSYNKSQPTIILPSDDVSVVSKPIIAKKVTSQSRLTVPTSSNCNKKAPNISENPGHELSVESSSFASLAVSLKSSSNSYLSNYDICNITDLDCDDSASDICDNALIKRSKSADYIRQMPQLKALNEKDYDIKLQKGNNKMLVVVKSDSNSNCSIEQAEEAVELEVPTLFTDIKITDTIQQNEDGIVPYTLYCIEYTGIFHDTRSVLGSPQFVTQNVSIKRRFSEFVALQSRLEENPVLKIFLKGIKGPSKWTTLPFSNLDKRYIAERKVFLENYLKALCDIAPIAQSSELQEFLAYGGDARISFVRRTGDISVPRIDKFFVRGVRGAIDMFKTALPSSPLEVEGILPVKTSLEEPSSDQRFHEYLLDFSYREPEIKEHVNNFFQNSVGNQSYENSSHKGKDIDAKGKKSSLLRNLSNFKIEECCSCTGLHDNYLEDEYPFGNTMIELLDAAVDFNAMKLGDLRTKLVLLLSPLINRYMVNKIDCISDEHLAYALHSLHMYLWPDEVIVNAANTGQDNSANIEKIVECLEDLFSSNYFLHNGVYSVKSTVLEKMKLFILSLQDEKLNKCLLFHMFDVIVEYVCSEA